ncbi:UDP-N-acetylmuramate dehydrogenase [Alkalicoccobacillus plakortidis]|uniref:UDP-N-acetylenolpyruvoylglucosamine reductase n=1 Tax=Alkalicoccobacillus plakortidis TaxID=444060 RepID=A0ABT0XKC0_9BACI|nr:UDP-N-acetylmuramate dehydrogenase [Alkalicoccobacillus plakortidis]MCM2676353.1 UDP-N-acetylmuramate dehydrogenase [Alkalicoccobacillus plakortidis]
MNYESIYNELLNHIKQENVCLSEPLRNHVYTKLGGNADLFVTPESIDELKAALDIRKKTDIPLTILGSGSNVIIKDGGIRGLTIGMSKMTNFFIEGERLVVQSGAAIIEASRKALEHRLSGLEFACGIPGSVGGALYMNAGAYGGQISEVLDRATVMTQDGEILTIETENLALGYRESIFMESDYVILEAEFGLSQGDPVVIKAKMDALTEARESKQPLEYPSCGSVFKRPPGHFAGKLIQESNLQGTRIGGAEVSKKHAGFIVNIDQATSKDYLDLIDLVKATVKDTFHVELDTEVIVLGEDLEEQV